MTLDTRSERNLVGVKPVLVRVVRRAADLVEDATPGLGFIVTEGVRSQLRQAELVRVGASQTMKSYHLTGDAVDLAATLAGEVRWDWPLYTKLAAGMKAAAAELGAVITWGGDWKMRDGPHFQLEQGART